MTKLNRLCAMLLLVAFVGVAWGAATKIPSFVVEESFTACPSGDVIALNLDAAADGMAILNYVPGGNKTIVQVIVSDFTGAPLQRFIVRLEGVDGDVGTFPVDSQGNGHFHGEVGGDQSGSNVELWQQVDSPFAPDNCPAVLIASGG